MVGCDECGNIIDISDNECYCFYCGVICEKCSNKCNHKESEMKIKSTIKKMRGLRFLSLSQTPDNPFNSKGEVQKPIINKKEFRKLQTGQEITVNEVQFGKLNERFSGLFEVEGDENPKPKQKNDLNIIMDKDVSS